MWLKQELPEPVIPDQMPAQSAIGKRFIGKLRIHQANGGLIAGSPGKQRKLDGQVIFGKEHLEYRFAVGSRAVVNDGSI